MEKLPECPYCGYPMFSAYVNGWQVWQCICDESKEKHGTLAEAEEKANRMRKGLTWGKTDLVETRGVR